MELFGIVLAMPAACVASIVFSLVLRIVLRRWPLQHAMFWSSAVVMASVVAEWVALARLGPAQLQAATGGAFYPAHLVLFFLGIPAFVTVLVVKRGETWLGSWVAVGIMSAVLALPFVLIQYAVSEALYGIG